MKWLRLYHDARTDAKLEHLADDEFRVWFRLLIFASEQPTRGHIEPLPEELLAIEVSGGDIALLQRTLEVLKRLRIVSNDDGITFKNRDYFKDTTMRPLRSEWVELRTAVFVRDDYTCQYCGNRGVRLECDHIVPISRGGSSALDNLATACRCCNQSKRDKTLEEWGRI